MTEKIEPALTAEEWADVIGGQPLTFTSEPTLSVIDAGDGIKFLAEGTPIESSVMCEIDSWDTAGLAQLAAVLLNALPTGHPLKITREDVALVREVAEDYEHRGNSTNAELLSLAAKLAALLPPEGV